MDPFKQFAQDKSFKKDEQIWILLVVLENTFVKQMIQIDFTIFCILETNSFALKFFTQYRTKSENHQMGIKLPIVYFELGIGVYWIRHWDLNPQF